MRAPVLLPIREELPAVSKKLFPVFSKFVTSCFTLDDNEKRIVRRIDADIRLAALLIMTELPFLLEDDVFGAITLFKKAIDALQYDKVGCRIVALAKPLRPQNGFLAEIDDNAVVQHVSICFRIHTVRV